MITKTLALKLDVDTLKGYLEGVPRLLDLFQKKNIPASIFFSMGPDNSGKAIRRVFRKGFISKMMRTKAPTTYGFKTLLYGTLLPAPLIVSKNPGILARAAEDHDCGVHAWDHVLIQDGVGNMTRDKIREEYRKAFDLFEKTTGRCARSMAAPGWQATGDSFAVEDELELDYASDCRGTTPFYPEIRSTVYKTLQIPTTLPTMDEIYGGPGDTSIADLWLSEMRRETEVLTIHAEMEGGRQVGPFEEFLDRATCSGIRFTTLREIANETREVARVCEIELACVRGRAGTLIRQVPRETPA